MKSKLTDEDKIDIINNLNIKIGSDINNLADAHDVEGELIRKKKHLQSCLNVANDEVPTKLSSTLKKAEHNSKQIQNLKIKSEQLKLKVEDFLNRTKPLRTELDKRFSAINRLEGVLLYLKSFEKIDELSSQMKQCTDDEQLVQLYGELKVMCSQYNKGHQAAYVKEYTHYWHNVLKDSLTKHYEDILKLLKWPFTSSSENSLPPKELLTKFTNMTRYLFLIQEPEDSMSSAISDEFNLEPDPCLPVKILLRPLKKRFAFHFTGARQTARIDRPEWFLTQTLTWIRDHQTFVKNHVQPVADKLEMKSVNAVEEFNAGLIALAAERLHTVLGLYITQGAKGEIVDIDGAFAHAIDETLGFHRELSAITDFEMNSVLAVLTKAETFVRWLSVEKKYALSKMDEALGNEQWSEPVAAGVSVAVGSVLWVPRSADWFIALLKTIEDRYAMLPQPGHRLQFLELQLELIEEWRIRLTQLMSAAMDSLQPDSFLTASSPHPLTAVINAAHYTRMVLLQWAHSLHYLQLHFYRRQFEYFTQQQHRDDETETTTSSGSDEDDDYDSEEDQAKKRSRIESEINEAMSLNELEFKAKMMALSEMSRRTSLMHEQTQYDIATPIANLAVTEPLARESGQEEEAGVFAEAPALLAHLRDAGLSALADHILLEFKATIRDYKKQRWHAMLTVEERALSVSGALCGPLAALCARLAAAAARLAPALAVRLRARLAAHLDRCLLQEMVLETWFNTGGTLQFTHDVKRNLVPAFAPPNKAASQVNQLPRLLEACKLLNMDYDDARRLRSILSKQPTVGTESLTNHGITHIQPNEALQILSQRTDLSDASTPSSVMELF